MAETGSPAAYFYAEEGSTPDQPSSTSPNDSVVASATSGSSPICQTRLFEASTDCVDRDNDNDDDNNNIGIKNNAVLERLHNRTQVLDMAEVKQEEEEEREGDSNCSASEATELISSSYDAWKERLEVLVLDDNENFIDDSLPNYTLVAKPLGENVHVASREAGWLPNPQKEEAGEPLMLTTQDYGMNTPLSPSLRKKPPKTTKRGSKSFTPYPLGLGRSQLPKGVEEIYLHKERTITGDPVAKCARFNRPITMVKTMVKEAEEGADGVVPTEEVTWTRVHVTFQSTSSTNISTVNALNASQLFVRAKERGRGKTKCHWAIEMNKSHQLYLGSYGGIDTIDINN
jgi:hypothetical protein